VKLFAALAALWAVTLTWLGLYHPYGLRFSMGAWPVPAGTPWTYQLLSGFIPALTAFTLLSAVTALYHVHNCHHEGCWRLGKHKVKGTPWCTLHEDEGRAQETTDDLLREILAELRSQGGQRM
jgi:hypothetical protein